nr:T9SS type A sorting domain-containing protein [Cyclobacteriaceae bacterium]
SATNANADWTSIQYAIYLRNNAQWEVRQSGSGTLFTAPYAANDVFKIAVEANVVKYYQNNVLRFSSGVVPTLPLLADVSINTVGGTVTNALVVNNSNAGFFSATATNAGTSPFFEWRVNGITVQTGTSNTYTNTSLLVGDVITCLLTPDIAGCTASAYLSNSITINGPGKTTVWTGVISSNWYIPGNWSDGIPDRFTTVLIPAGTPNNAILNADASLYDITINSGATFTISGSSQLFVYRSFNNNGSFIANTSRIHFIGCSNASEINCNGTQTFFNVTVNSNFNLTVRTGVNQIQNNLTLTRGILFQQATLSLLNASTATNASNLSYIDGPVRKVGNQAFTFPVGNNGFFRPISISAPTTNTHAFTARYFNQNHLLGSPAVWDPSFFTVSSCEYWTLDRNTGASNVFVTLSWNESACNPGYITNPATLRVARWTGTNWVNQGNGGTTGTAVNGTIITSSAVTSFSPFTLASTTPENPLPIELVYFRAKRTPEKLVYLEWTTALEINNERFEIERSTDGLNFQKLYEMPGAGNANQPITYSWIDRFPLLGISYYRLKQIDFDGQFSYSDVVSVRMEGLSPFQVYPNPAGKQWVAFNRKVNVVVTNNLGQLVAGYNDAEGFDTANYAPGIYFIRTDLGEVVKLIIH